MNITTQLNGENVTIVDMNNNGHDLFVTYVKENGDLTVQKLYNNPTSLINTVSTSAAVVGAVTSAALNDVESGIEFTGGFAGKPTSANYVWEEGEGFELTNNGLFNTFSFDRNVHLNVDAPYWTDPTPADHTDKGVFGGSYLPANVPTVFDYTFVDNDTYNDGSNVVTTGRIDMSNFKVGDTIRVRFDFNVIPSINNTTIEPAIWYKNRDSNDNVTFTFPLTSSPVFYGISTAGKTFLNRTEISVYVASEEDINAVAQLAIKTDNIITIQPLSVLLTLIR